MDEKSSLKSNAAVNDKRTFSSAFMSEGGQDAALRRLVINKTPICLFLTSGVKLEGIVSAFDQYTVSITDVKDQKLLIYKDKISTITLKKAF